MRRHKLIGRALALLDSTAEASDRLLRWRDKTDALELQPGLVGGGNGDGNDGSRTSRKKSWQLRVDANADATATLLLLLVLLLRSDDRRKETKGEWRPPPRLSAAVRNTQLAHSNLALALQPPPAVAAAAAAAAAAADRPFFSFKGPSEI
ncbi:hypothetical protein PANT_12d00128 [Moesziomyces antarcticus T-34]|uniref:Uncharacterized protein n=1 Tax=Pseudozyma antarctica (strain T-34) TaxID=1151754 RepID=M9MDV6_PSEA3|nr:hypothetical protein PANT_12d00128 [Moesziomyces antarcticus T-34]